MMDPLIVLRRTVAVHASLEGIDHAIGGALALAYHVRDARATQDIYLNVSVPKERAAEALRRLPSDVPYDEESLRLIGRDGQVRLMWPAPDGPPIPLDLFFAEHAFHYLVSRRALWVPMLDTRVPILTATDLAVFKVLFDRSKDWVDLEEIIAEAPPSWDLEEAVRWIAQIVGPGDGRIDRLRGLAGG